MPVPDRDDFRVNLGCEIENEIRSIIETTVRSRYADAQHDLWACLMPLPEFVREARDRGDDLHTALSAAGLVADSLWEKTGWPHVLPDTGHCRSGKCGRGRRSIRRPLRGLCAFD